jgi:hypothetical protein
MHQKYDIKQHVGRKERENSTSYFFIIALDLLKKKARDI